VSENIKQGLWVKVQMISVGQQFCHYINNGINNNKAVKALRRFGAVGSDVGQINEVTLRRARLVLGWVTVSGFNSCMVREIYLSLTNHLGQLSLAIPLWVGSMSTGQRAVMLCGGE